MKVWNEIGNILPPVTFMGLPTTPDLFEFYRSHYQGPELDG
jgi:hypothetical protein